VLCVEQEDAASAESYLYEWSERSPQKPKDPPLPNHNVSNQRLP
jgi:hypothetical protein